MTIAEARRRAKKSVDMFPSIRSRVSEELEPEIAASNREQLMEGLDSEGNRLSPGYSLFTRRMKQRKGQPDDRVTLFDTGAFHKGIFAETDGDSVLISSKDPKTDSLEEKYGEGIFGISDESSARLRKLSVARIVRMVKEITGF